MELTFYCVPSCDQVPIPGKGTWILVENLKKTSGEISGMGQIFGAIHPKVGVFGEIRFSQTAGCVLMVAWGWAMCVCDLCFPFPWTFECSLGEGAGGP